MSKRIAILLALALGVLLSSCGQSSNDEALAFSDDAVITYRYGDSSVPPEYHRSYELTVTIDQVRIVVDSYGDVLADETFELDAAAWNELRDSLNDIVDLEVDETDEGCTGGTSRSVAVVDASVEIVNKSVYVCGGEGEEVADAIDDWIQPALASVDDLDALLE